MASKSVLRDDEEFVIDAVAKAFAGAWSVGEGPPDAYLTIGANIVAVEISTLTQHVTDDRGTRPRLSDDTGAAALANELNAELQHLIPDGHTIGLVLSSPILNFRKTKAALAKELRALISDLQSFPNDTEMNFYGNKISGYLNHHGESHYKKLSAVISHRSASADILSNTMFILEERIIEKAGKCAHLTGQRPLWLALFNDYWLTDLHSYKYALSHLSLEHPFDQIFLVQGDEKVEALYDAEASLASEQK